MIIAADQVRQSLPWLALIEALRQQFIDGCEMPVRHHHDIRLPEEADATLLLMPAWIEGRYIGYLANDPNHMPNKQIGSKVHFSAQQIRDRGYFGANGKLFGHYTTRVLVKTLPQNQAKPILDLLSDYPVPNRWEPL